MLKVIQNTFEVISGSKVRLEQQFRLCLSVLSPCTCIFFLPTYFYNICTTTEQNDHRLRVEINLPAALEILPSHLPKPKQAGVQLRLRPNPCPTAADLQ